MNTPFKMKQAKKLVPELRFPEFKENWKVKKLGDNASFSKGKGISKSDIIEEGKNLCIRYGELYTEYNEKISKEKVVSKTNVSYEKSKLSKANDVIIPSSGETQLDIATASFIQDEGIIMGGDLNIIRSEFNGLFLAYYLNNKKKIDIAKLAQGNSVVHLYNKNLSSLFLNIPSLPEQQKIADFLSQVDKKIDLLSQKYEHLEQYKKGVMQKLFSQEVRFKREDGSDYRDWEEKKLGEFLISKSKRNKDLKISRVLSVSNTKGFITQSEQFENHRVASKNVSNYKIVKEYDIAYNPSRINVGSIAVLKDYEKGIVSPMYVIFRLKKDLNLTYFENLIETHLFKHYVIVGCSGSVRESLNYEELEKFQFQFPCLAEQTKIANYLSAIDQKISFTQQQLEQTQRFKKGLLQKMFV